MLTFVLLSGLPAIGIGEAFGIGEASGIGSDSAARPLPAVAAHRGSMAVHPENTMAAFRWAQAAGFHMIELDLRITRDYRFVAMHDATVNRTTNGRGKVRGFSFEQIRALDAGDGQRVPAVEEVLRFGDEQGMLLLLDLKPDRRLDVTQLVGIIDQHGMTGQVTVGVRSVRLLKALKAADNRLDTLGFVPSAAEIEPFAAAGADGIRLWASWVRSEPGLLDRVLSAGSRVWISAGDLQGEALQGLLGPDVHGLITDHPLEALARQVSLAPGQR